MSSLPTIVVASMVDSFSDAYGLLADDLIYSEFVERGFRHGRTPINQSIQNSKLEADNSSSLWLE